MSHLMEMGYSIILPENTSPVLNENDTQMRNSVGLPDSVSISDTNTFDESNTSPVSPIPQATSTNRLPTADTAGLDASEGNVLYPSNLGLNGESVGVIHWM